MSFAGKTALVTGAARGIGFAIASRFASDGARVVVVDLDGPAADAAAKRLGPEAVAVTADVTRTADVERAVQVPLDRWGRLDIVVNNAGITGRTVPLWELRDGGGRRARRLARVRRVLLHDGGRPRSLGRARHVLTAGR